MVEPNLLILYSLILDGANSTSRDVIYTKTVLQVNIINQSEKLQSFCRLHSRSCCIAKVVHVSVLKVDINKEL